MEAKDIDTITASKLIYILSGCNVRPEEFNEIIDLMQEHTDQQTAHLTEQNKMLRVLVEKSVAYGMGYVCGKPNLPMRKAEIRKTASEYSKQALSNTKPKEE